MRQAASSALDETAAMRILPVVERELRVTARNRRFYWNRLATALVSLGLFIWIWVLFPGGSSAAMRASFLFGTLSTVFFGYALLMGLLLTADAISEEKREGTLGLLFLTNLKSHDIVLGKLAGSSARSFYSLMAVFPVLMIPVLMGGVEGEEIGRMTLVLLNTMLFSMSIGLLVSACSRQSRKAQVGAFSVVALVTAGIPAAVAFLREELRIRGISEGLYALSPAYGMICAFKGTYAAQPREFWMSMAAMHGMFWLALTLAILIVRRVWQDRPAVGEVKGWRKWLAQVQAWKRGSPAVRRRHRAALLGMNPYCWLAARDRLLPAHVLWFLGGCGLFWCALWLFYGDDMLEQEMFFCTALFVQSCLKYWIASAAVRQISEDRNTGALELILSTPLPPRVIVNGQVSALVRQFGWPILIMVAFNLAGLAVSGRVTPRGNEEWFGICLAMTLVFVADSAALAYAGMWRGLSSSRPGRAAAQTFFIVVMLPILIFFGIMTFFAFSRMGEFALFLSTYIGASLIADWLLFKQASTNLTLRFRQTAAGRFGGEAGRAGEKET